MSGRQKGAGAEREVAKLLEGWWASLEPGVRFVRVPLSGGWGTPALRPDFQASGDLATTARRFPWTVEVKRREGWSLKEFLAGRRSPVWGWWAQAERQAGECGKEPMLWFRANRQPWRVLVVEPPRAVNEASRYSLATVCTFKRELLFASHLEGVGRLPRVLLGGELLGRYHPEWFALPEGP